MENTEKTSKRVKRVKHTPILVSAEGENSAVAKIEPAPQETQPQPTQQTEEKPLFTTDNSEIYRTLLLERPGVPVITNIHEAVTFVGDYERWNSKVKLQFK